MPAGGLSGVCPELPVPCGLRPAWPHTWRRTASGDPASAPNAIRTSGSQQQPDEKIAASTEAVDKLKDLRLGDRVRGEVRVEKKVAEKKQIALKIYVDRHKPVGDEGG